MHRFARYSQYIHVFPWWKNDYELWHTWLFFFAEWLSCVNQHVPTLEVTWERKERSIKSVLEECKATERYSPATPHPPTPNRQLQHFMTTRKSVHLQQRVSTDPTCYRMLLKVTNPRVITSEILALVTIINLQTFAIHYTCACNWQFKSYNSRSLRQLCEAAANVRWSRHGGLNLQGGVQ